MAQLDTPMSNRLDLPDVTGAEVAWIERVEGEAETELHTVPRGRYRYLYRIAISEHDLRDWWNRLRSCWASEEQFANGYKAPHPERYRHRRDPKIGFHLTGHNVGPCDGFTVCWYAGFVELGFDEHFAVFRFDLNFEDANKVRLEIESRLPKI